MVRADQQANFIELVHVDQLVIFETGAYETSASTAISSSNRAKSATLNVASRFSPFARIVATMFASWTCFPFTP